MAPRRVIFLTGPPEPPCSAEGQALTPRKGIQAEWEKTRGKRDGRVKGNNPEKMNTIGKHTTGIGEEKEKDGSKKKEQNNEQQEIYTSKLKHNISSYFPQANRVLEKKSSAESFI